MTTRSGFMKSSMAVPSLRNSGLLATSQGRPVSSARRRVTAALVPTGTVLLSTTMASAVRWGAISATTAHKAVRSASPLAFGGVPTARNTSFARGGRLRQIGGEMQPALGHVAADQLGQPRLVDGHLRGPQHFDLRLVAVDARDVVARLGQTGARHQPHVAGPDDRNSHDNALRGRIRKWVVYC